MPMEDLRRQYPFLGDDSLTMEQAMQMMRDLQQLDQLEAALQEAIRTGDLSDIDPEKLAELLGEDARRVWDELDNLRKLLEEAGYITGGDKAELTARGIRRIGQKALKEVFAHLKKDRIGGHRMDTRGANGDLLGETKTYEFGDPFQVDLQTTVKNAVLRGGPQVPVRISPQDFEVHRTEHMTKAATILLLDQSRSMGPVQQLAGRQEGHRGPDGPDSLPVPPRHPPCSRLLRLRPRNQRGRAGVVQLERPGYPAPTCITP